MTLQKIALLLASTLTVMAGAAIAPALPALSDHFADIPNIDLLIKLLLTLPAIFIALLSPLAGWIIDRSSKKRLLLGAMVLYAIGGAGGFLLDNIWLLLGSRAILGIAVAAILTTVTTLVGDYFEGSARNRFLGTQGAVMAFGGTVFVTISGLLADQGWRYPFLIYLLSLPILLLSARYLTDPPISSAVSGQQRERVPLPRLIWMVYGLTFLGMIAFYIVPTQNPFLLRQNGAASPSWQSLGLVVATLAAAAMSQSYSKLRSRFSFAVIYVIGFTLMAIGFAGLGLTTSFGAAVAFSALAGAGAGTLMPNGSTWALALSDRRTRGRLMGGLSTAIFLGQFVSPLVFEPIVSVSNLYQAHLFASGALLLIGLGVLIWSHQYRRVEQSVV